MNRLVIGAIVITTLGVRCAYAADASVPYGPPQPYPDVRAPYPSAPPQYAPLPYAAPYIYPWIGPYFGVNGGIQWTTNPGGPSPRGITGGMQSGFNWQNGPWVYGVEGDLSLSGANDRFADYQFYNPVFGTARGRSGYTFGNYFIYATAGLAFSVGTVASGGLSDSSAHLGWTIGTGFEFGLASFGLSPNWSAKAEYLYLNASQGAALPASVPLSIQSNIVRFGVNYHF
jgi:outer membrane immunogenic protein